MLQSRIAPHDNEQMFALPHNAYFYSHSGHTFFVNILSQRFTRIFDGFSSLIRLSQCNLWPKDLPL
jgi:hypothetical protein